MRIAALARLVLPTPLVAHVRLYEDAIRIRRESRRLLLPQALVAISRFIYQQLSAGHWADPGTTVLCDDSANPSVSNIALIYDPFDAQAFGATVSKSASASVKAELGIFPQNRIVLLPERICHEKASTS